MKRARKVSISCLRSQEDLSSERRGMNGLFLVLPPTKGADRLAPWDLSFLMRRAKVDNVPSGAPHGAPG